MRILVIDHQDSFTFNLVSYLEDLVGQRPTVVNHDEKLSIEFIASFDAVIFSPGPGRVDNPVDIGNTLNIIKLADVPRRGVAAPTTPPNPCTAKPCGSITTVWACSPASPAP